MVCLVIWNSILLIIAQDYFHSMILLYLITCLFCVCTCAHMCICVFHGILSQGVFSFFFILKSRDQVSFNDWVGRRKGNLKCWPLKHRRSKSYLVFFLGFFCKINYRMFMQLWWTLYSLSATNLSECYSLSEIGTIKSYLQMSRLLLVKGDKSQLAWEAVAKFALTFSTQAYKRALFQVK